MALINRGKYSLAAVLAAALCFDGGFVFAQVQDAPAPAGAAQPADGADIIAAPPQISPEEMSTKSKTLFGEIDVVLKKVEKLEEIAKKEKDVIKLNCVV